MLNILKKINIISFLELESTNNYAKELISKDNPVEWTIINADFQTAGRGQQGNSWESQASENLTFSIILKPVFLHPSQQFKLNKAVSLGISDFLKKYNIDNVKIKWPNDIYVDNNKIAGVLIENTIIGSEYSYCIIGIGININQLNCSTNIKNFTSLRKITRKYYYNNKCLNDLLICIYSRYLKLIDNPEIIDSDYYENLYLLGKTKKFIINNKNIEATITGVNEYGMLLLKTQDNKEFCCNFKEIVFTDFGS
ncbi:biotin--[acetyl-CoA-carboxylase] ligase [bacterium]|nr:biotin--[acetyl-CoA-carboxylase] ligase [bacterium]